MSIVCACVLKRELQQTVYSFDPVLRENNEIYIELSFKAVGSVILFIRIKIIVLDFRNLPT